ncbi:MAG TPA: helix-turn-helix transcriptional regulator [Solirubrobacteraceae bacterium]|nr:helix-turn-helix transcriptional regulator [Solirubrobacteraceae bacterium]
MSNDRIAGELIRQIRGRSGLSQAELARRTGIQSSVLSAYEHGRRQPSAAALARIARAAELELTVAPLSNQIDLERSGTVLKAVLDLADAMPKRRRGELAYPPLMRLGRLSREQPRAGG